MNSVRDGLRSLVRCDLLGTGFNFVADFLECDWSFDFKISSCCF